ncbi:hypothetical protein JCM33374_g4760 [Metschnikowia sp. JCM 33374]|nr:hypothetical protein JCM33374_g4760 [Metschnikowia sp. JCM 33374]
MRLLGYPWASLSIGVASEQMGVLIEEILVEQKIHKADKPSQTPAAFSFGWPIIQHVKSFFPSEYTIVSCHGNPKIREYQEIAEKSRMGLYLVGSEADHPYKIKTGDLEIVPNEVYNSTKREGKNIRSLNRAAQLGQLVEQLKEKSKVNLTTV